MLLFDHARIVDPDVVAPARPLPTLSELVDQADDTYAVGFADGKAAATAEQEQEMASARRRLEEAVSALMSAAAQLKQARTNAVALEVHDVARLAFELVELMVGETPRNLSQSVVERALTLAPDDGDLTVRVNPSDAETVNGLVTGVEIVADPEIEPGGCVVEVGATRIDAQIGPALERLRSVLRRSGSSAAA